MPIVDTDFVWRQPRSISNTTPAQNGGRMSSTAITSGVKNNLFPDVSQAQRSAGVVQNRKAFIHVASSSNIELLDGRVFISQATPADDWVTIHPGSQTDTEDQITGRAYGAAELYLDAEATDQVIQLTTEWMPEASALEPFQAGDIIRISDGVNEEWHEIDTVVADSSNEFLEVTLVGQLANPFDQSGTLVSSCIEAASVLASISNVVVTSATGGTLNSASLVAHNKGATHDTITLTFTSATAFTAAGLIAGSLGSGTRSADFSPTNSGIGTPYFTIPSTAWGGTFAAGNTVVFTLNPASIPLWYRREVPAGANSLANDSVVVSVYGESA